MFRLRPRRRRHAARRLVPFAALGLSIFGLVGDAALAASRPPRMNPHAVSWSALEFRATKLFLTADATVAIEHLPARIAGRELRATVRDDDLQPRGPVGHLRVTSKLAGRESEEEVFFALIDGGTFERRKRQLGRKPYFRSERYTQGGVDGERRRPADPEDTNPERWTIADRRFDARVVSPADRVLIHPLALFYLASAGRLLAVGDRISADAHADHRFVPIDLTVMEVVDLEVGYTERRGDAERRGKRRVEALRIEVRDASNSDSDLEFLGLESGIEIFVTREGRIPVLVRGRLGGLGRLDIRLTAANLRPAGR